MLLATSELSFTTFSYIKLLFIFYYTTTVDEKCHQIFFAIPVSNFIPISMLYLLFSHNRLKNIDKTIHFSATTTQTSISYSATVTVRFTASMRNGSSHTPIIVVGTSICMRIFTVAQCPKMLLLDAYFVQICLFLVQICPFLVQFCPF